MTIVARGINRTRRESLAEFVFAVFVFFQDFAGAFDDAAGKTGEAGNFDAVAFVGAAGLDAAQKNNFAGRFFDGNMDVLDRRKKIGELGELVIMRGKQRARTRVLLQMLDDGPGDGKAVKRGRAAADFIEKDQACVSGVVIVGQWFTLLRDERVMPPGRTAVSPFGCVSVGRGVLVVLAWRGA